MPPAVPPTPPRRPRPTLYLGHAYRVVAVAKVTLASGATMSAAAHSKAWAP